MSTLEQTRRALGGGARMPNEKALRNARDRIAGFRAFCPVSREESGASCKGCALAPVGGLENVEDCAMAWLELPSERRATNGSATLEAREKSRLRMRRTRARRLGMTVEQYEATMEERRNRDTSAASAARWRPAPGEVPTISPMDTADAPEGLVWTREPSRTDGCARLGAVAALAVLSLVVAGCARLAALRSRDAEARRPLVVEAPCLDAGAFAFRATDARGRSREALLDVGPADMLRIGAGGTAPVVDESGAPCGTVFGWRVTPSNLVAVAALDARGRAAWRAGATNLDARLTVAADFSGAGAVRCAPRGVAEVALSREPHTFNLRKGRKE